MPADGDHLSATDTQDVTDNGPGTPPAPDSTPSSSRLRGLLAQLEFTGVILAVIFAWLSATPSLLPRGPSSRAL